MNKDFIQFINTLKSSIKTWDYFINWSKVLSNSSEIEVALNKLNYLLGKINLKDEFDMLYRLNPDIIKALPILLAIRGNKLEVYDKELKTSEFFDFSTANQSSEEYYQYIIRSGLGILFQKEGIKNLVDYVMGVEVGLDSNGRKNRGGSLMEEIVQSFLNDFCKLNKLEIIPQASASIIKYKWNYIIKFEKSERKFDFAIYNPENNKIKLIETNFYNGGGSKLKTVCSEFRALHDELNQQNIDFIWITDGLGWKTSTRPLEETYNHNQYVFNLHLLESGVLNHIDW